MKRPRKRGASVAVIDIGSNSVRLVVYEALARSLIPIFNEKTLCGLGREVQSTGLLAPDAVDKALTSLKRFRALCRVMQVGRVFAIATAACRDASNGPDFIARAERICAVKIEILSGPREAKLSALGVISGIHRPDGIGREQARALHLAAEAAQRLLVEDRNETSRQRLVDDETDRVGADVDDSDAGATLAWPLHGNGLRSGLMAFVPARETARRGFLERLSTAGQTRIRHEIIVQVEGLFAFRGLHTR